MLTPAFKHNQVEIGKLRALGAPRGAPAVRLAFECLLGSADLRPPTMPPSTVLVVRRMSDPKPGKIAPKLVATRVQSEWERQARHQLAEHYRRAARPAWGPVAESVEAVCFADEAELLACLARDACQGATLHQWWWRAIVRSMAGNRMVTVPHEVVAVLVQQLHQHAAYLPGVMARLQQWGDALNFVRLLAPAQAQRLQEALRLVFDLPSVVNRGVMPTTAQRPPWNPGITPPLLGREQAALLGLSLDLHARAYEVRTQSYWRSFHAWWQSNGDNFVPAPPSPRNAPGAQAGQSISNLAPPTGEKATTPDAASMLRTGVGDGTDVELQWPAHVESASRLHPSQQRSMQPAPLTDQLTHKPLLPRVQEVGEQPVDEAWMEPQARPSIEPDARAADSPVAPADHRAQAGMQTPQLVRDQSGSTIERGAEDGALPDLAVLQEADAAMPEPQLWRDAAISTQLGGVLYLINMMVALDLLDCFEAGWRLASRVGSWGLLEALGRELLGDTMLDYEDDPLWAMLAQLDGRAVGQRPGARLPRTRPRRWPTFQLPAVWLANLPHQDQVAYTRHTRPRWQPKHRYAPLLTRWLEFAMPYLVQRLCLALNVGAQRDLADALLRVPGCVYLTTTHVDLVTSINSISLAVRLAGLDRNPGWLADFGRVIYFHFE